MSKDSKISELNSFEEQMKRHDGYMSYSVSADYTITDVDRIKTIYVTTSTSTITITLPTAANNLDRIIEIIKIDSGSGKIVVDGEGAETILGSYVGGSSTTAEISQQYGWIAFKINETGSIIINGGYPDKWHLVGEAGEPSFENSWVNFNPSYTYAAFRKILNGNVEFKGVVSSGTIGNTVFTLPTGYRLSGGAAIIGTASNGAFGEIVVSNTGTVAAAVGNNVWFSLDNNFINIL
jgi:hypothetical protein